MPLPLVNADITSIASPESGDDWHTVTPGATVWSGAVAAYYREQSDLQPGIAGANLLIRRYLVVQDNDPPILFAQGMSVTIRMRKTARMITAKVRAIRRAEAPAGIPSTLATTKVWLEDA
jgi:hypothetical protein